MKKILVYLVIVIEYLWKQPFVIKARPAVTHLTAQDPHKLSMTTTHICSLHLIQEPEKAERIKEINTQRKEGLPHSRTLCLQREAGNPKPKGDFIH